MKIYLCARFGRQAEMRGHRDTLTAAGHEVTSRWLDVDESAVPEADYPEHARTDIEDIQDSDVLLAFSEEPDSPHGRGGRHVEFGYALWNNKYCAVIGPRENIFHHLVGVPVFATIEEAIDRIGRLQPITK